MKRQTVIRTILGTIIAAFVALSVSAFSIAWFSGFGGMSDGNVHGDIGLRGYYHTGNGDDNFPYEITKPSHLYNLARLQNRGVYPEKRYFQIGHVFDPNEGPVCLDENGNHVKVLDMTSYCATHKLPPIGAEGTPFCSEINGNGIPIVGLKVKGNPEDVGVFGYVDSRGVVENMIFKNLEVHSTGYSDGSGSAQDYSDDLFDRTIDDLFDEHASTFGQARLEWVGPLTTENLKNTSGFPMNNINAPANMVVVEGETTTQVKGHFRKVDPPSEPGKPFTYDWHSSAGLIDKAMVNGEEVMVIDLADIATGEFNSGGRMTCNTRISLTASTVYDGIKYSRVIQSYDVEFYSNATVYSQGGYSAVVYCDYIDENPRPGEHPTNYHHGYNVGLIAGHVDGSMSNCYVYDGTMLFNGVSGNTPISSESQTGLVGEIGVNVHSPINPAFGQKVNGETGVMNFSGIYGTIRRDFQNGDSTFIRRAALQTASLNSSKTDVNYRTGDLKSCISYNDVRTEEAQFNKFAEYLRHDYDSTPGYEIQYVTSADSAATNLDFDVVNTKTNATIETTIEGATPSLDTATFVSMTNNTKGGIFVFVYDGTNWKLDKTVVSLAAYGISLEGGEPEDGHTITVDISFTTNASPYNSVDFLWNNVIADERDEDNKLIVDRGLGVFKIATQYRETYKWMVEHEMDPIEAGCYLDGIGASRIINGAKKHKVYFSTAECDWRKDAALGSEGWSSISPFRAATIPSYSDIDSFRYPFSRDFNYCFEMDLSEPNKPIGKNYFYNAKGFLLNYLESILIDENNTRLTPIDDRFGFMLCDSLGNSVDGLSAYMPLGKPGDFSEFHDGEEIKKYPSNSIVFKIDNETGANVSVIASDADVSVYRNWKNDATGKPAGVGDLEELFTMRSRGLADSVDTARFFPYTLHAVTSEDNPTGDPVAHGSGVIVPQEGNMSADNALYAHTFKLPKGEFVLGASKKLNQGNAKIYYLAVQGQEDANLGRVSEAFLGKGIEDVDFLLSDPCPTPAPVSPSPYSPGVTTAGGVALEKAEFSFEGNFNTGAGGIQIKKKDDDTCIQILFNGSFSTPNVCTDALLAYCRKASPRYFLNAAVSTETLTPWPASQG